MARRFDIIIFGATGYTGKFAVEDLARSISTEKTSDITWAVAARNKNKTIKVLKDVQDVTGIDLSNIEVIEADVSNEESLKKMTQQARVVVNYVGPYMMFGEAVVKACIETKTHHLDISGEPHYLESIQIKYGKKAEEAGVFVIGSCGFDSIPADLGTIILQDKFPGTLAWVETFISLNMGDQGYKVNHGTWDSVVNALANWSKLKMIRETLYGTVFEKKTPSYKHRLHRRIIPFVPENQKLSIPYMDADRDTVRRTQTYKYIHENVRPVEMFNYMVIRNWFSAIALAIFGFFLLVLSQFSFGRKILTEYPHIITFGQFSKDGPTREQVLSTSAEMLVVGKGYKNKMSTPEDEPAYPPGEVTKTLKIKVPDPGYVATSTLMNQAAVTLIQDRDKIPFKGGVLTPGLVFPNTSLVQRLGKHNITFEEI